MLTRPFDIFLCRVIDHSGFARTDERSLVFESSISIDWTWCDELFSNKGTTLLLLTFDLVSFAENLPNGLSVLLSSLSRDDPLYVLVFRCSPELLNSTFNERLSLPFRFRPTKVKSVFYKLFRQFYIEFVPLISVQSP